MHILQGFGILADCTDSGIWMSTFGLSLPFPTLLHPPFFPPPLVLLSSAGSLQIDF